MVGEASSIADSPAHFRSRQHPSRLAQQIDAGPSGMGVAPTNILPTREPIRSYDSRPVCHSSKHQTEQVLYKIPNARSRGGGRVTISLATGPPLRLSPNGSDPQGHSQSLEGAGSSDPDCSLLGKETLVPGTPSLVDFSTLETTPDTTATVTRGHTASGPRVAQPSRLEAERLNLTDSQISSRVIATIQASRRPSTTRIYETTWRAFTGWCVSRSILPTRSSVSNLLEFLQDGLEKGLKPNTLRRQVAAIASVMNCDSVVPLSRHPMVTRFLRGAANLSPPVLHRYPTWELAKVLTALTQSPFEPLDTSSLRIRSWKTAFLIAITTARRISEISALSVRRDLCIFHQDRVVLRLDPTFLPKINSPFHREQEIILPDFCPDPEQCLEARWHTLDVRRALKSYIEVTRPIRSTEALFVQFHHRSLGQRASSSTIGRWLRATIALAYEIQGLPLPSNITAHSTRSAAMTAAWSAQATVDQICRAATWSSPSVFVRHYKLDTYAAADAAFGRRVLQSIHPAE